MNMVIKLKEKERLVSQIKKCIDFADKIIDKVRKVEEELVQFKLAGCYRCFSCYGNPKHYIEGSMADRHKRKCNEVWEKAVYDLKLEKTHFSIHLDIPDILEIDTEIEELCDEFLEKVSYLEDMFDLEKVSEVFWASYEKVKELMQVVYEGLVELEKMAKLRSVNMNYKQSELLRKFDFSEAVREDFRINCELETLVMELVTKKFKIRNCQDTCVAVDNGYLILLKDEDSKVKDKVILVDLKRMVIQEKSINEIVESVKDGKEVKI